MSEKLTQGIMEISIRIVKAVLCVMLIVTALLFFCYGLINRSVFMDRDPAESISFEYTSDDTVSATLPSDIGDNEYLFYFNFRDITVYVGDEMRLERIEERDVNIPGGTVKNSYMIVPLKHSDAGKQIRLVRADYDNKIELATEGFISTRSGAFSLLMQRYGASFFLAFILAIFSFVVFVVSIVLSFMFKQRMDMMYGALGIFVLSLWVITDSALFPFIFGMQYVDGILNYLLCVSIPFAPEVYLNSIQHGRYKRSMSVLMLLSAANAVIWPVLHFLRVLPFYSDTVRTTGNVILALLAVEAIFILVYDAIKGYSKEYRYTFIGFFGFLICCIIELVLLLVITTTRASLPMVAGLGVLLVFIVIQQVNDLRMANMEKQHAIDISEAKTRFLASMSHEIRTPINAILGMNEMILRENTDKVVDEYSRSIKTSGKMLLMLVNDVLDFSKIEAGKLEITRSRFFLSELLYDVMSLVSERAEEKSLELRTQINGEIPNEMESDEFRIRQILVNLINNAVKYTEKGTVTLILSGNHTQEDGYELDIVVKDTGKGIRQEDQEHLFEAFSRADTKANVNIEGTGLGLAIVKSIVDSMNGSVGVRSIYGKGSEFWVKLPVRYLGDEILPEDFMERRTAEDSVLEACSFTAPDAKILAVDDNQSNLTIVRLFLKRTGIVPDLCSSGNHAIELCREKKYDLILLDHMMPQPDGIETLHIIRSDKDSLNKDTRAVVLTANAVAGSRQMYIDEGFEDYLTKPLDSSILEQTVKNLLPPEKIRDAPVDSHEPVSDEDEVLEFGFEERTPVKDLVSRVEGLDIEAALSHCAGSREILSEILSDMASECLPRAERMRKSLAEKDLNAYRIEAHTIKSNMATLGMKELSERAKKHEFAARDNEPEFIEKDADGFISAYTEVFKNIING
ncbi:MAG: response regulator [Lachnospiraceae bacterium]|nr:response regulator [Lachnospiraceae bacterium]